MSARQAEPLRLVLDTQIWLDWLVFDDPGIRRPRNAVHLGRAVIYIHAACDAELARVLAYDLGRHRIGAAAQPGVRDWRTNWGGARGTPWRGECRGGGRRIAAPPTEQDEDREPPPN